MPKFVSMQGAGLRIVQIVCPFSLLSSDIFPQSLLATVALLTNKSHTDTAVSHQNDNDFPFQYLFKQLFKYVTHYTSDKKKKMLLRNILEDFGSCSKATFADVEWTKQAQFFKCLVGDLNSEFFQVDAFDWTSVSYKAQTPFCRIKFL